MSDARRAEPPASVDVRWSDDRATAAYRDPATARPRSLVHRPSRRAFAWQAALCVAGAALSAWLVYHGLRESRAWWTLFGAAFGVIAAVLADRVAPRVFNRTEVVLDRDALLVRQLPLGDTRPLRIDYGEVAGYEVEEVVEPMTSPPVVLHQVNARRPDGSVEPVFVGVDDPEAARWLRDVLDAHARGR